jgi:DnaJ-class molecular chaperone
MDPYKVLGVGRGADEDEIKKAYRQLAKEFHPDRHPGDAKAAERFKEISAAYSVLGNKASRGRFDLGEIDAWGTARRSATSESAAGAYSRTAGWNRAPGRDDASDTSRTRTEPDDFFSELFGRKRGAGKAAASRGLDQTYTITIPFLTAVTGGTETLTLRTGKAISVKIPKGVRDGQQIRLKGQGAPSSRGGENGDALVTLSVADHPHFKRQGDDIHIDVPVTLPEAVLGGRITVPTPWGNVSVTVPKGSNTGTVLRLKDKGIATDSGPKGHAYLALRIVLPDKPDAELDAFAKRWKAGNQANVRAGLAG